jgi:DtxR family Mn-dependent transcriptional regulator
MTISFTEENYIKAIFKLESSKKEKAIATNDIALSLSTQPASVTDMIKRLSDKKIISYKKYYGVSLTKKGRDIALSVVRKHRLWEVFLVNKLHFKWDEVHDIAEQLEHINSPELINKLDDFLGNPKVDPHGDVIPDRNGKMGNQLSFPLSQINKKQTVVFCGVLNHDPKFLQHLTTLNLSLGDNIKINSLNDYDRSFKVKIKDNKNIFLSELVASSILVSSTHDSPQQ